MNYTLHQLQVFLKITQTQSITKAAEELHLTQPAVSIQLKNFQDQFDIPLTEVVGRKLFVTDFGKEIAVAAEKILHEVHEINYKTLAYKGQLTGRLVISVVSTGKYVMPYFLPDFLQNNPGVDLKLDVTSKTNQMYMLAKSKIPGQNLWYTKTAMNRLMFDDLQNIIAPDYQRKYKGKMQKQGRSQWWESGEGLEGLNPIDLDEVVK